MMTKTLGPGSRLGMLGGGQLGRMFGQAARRSGFGFVVFGDQSDSPAGQISDHTFSAEFLNEDALKQFAAMVDVVSYEQENIPVRTVEVLQQYVPVYPGPALLKASQNRLLEKTALRSIGIPTADFLRITSAEELTEGVRSFGGDGILKTVTLGYDGKGQARVRSQQDMAALWSQFKTSEAILEKVVDFQFELSIVASRFGNGECRFYSPSVNHHVNHILDVSISPSPLISARQVRDAQQMAQGILEHFEVIGVLCVEFFATRDGGLVVNEIAPRPHNSGHLTMDACRSSQFEQQFRAICGLPSGDVQQQSPAVMMNLLGDHLMNATPERWASVFELPGVFVHMYGKAEARIGRKMGHLNVLAGTVEEAEAIGHEARRRLGFMSSR